MPGRMADKGEVGKNVLLANTDPKGGTEYYGMSIKGSGICESSDGMLETCDASSEPFEMCKRFSDRLLTMCVPRGRGEDMRRLLRPIFKHAQHSDQFVEVEEKEESLFPVMSVMENDIPKYMVSAEKMTAPGFAVIIFLPESGSNNVEHVKQKLQQFPWRHHHTIQLRRSRTSDVVAKQDFYFLSRMLPLWCVCPAYQDARKLRVNVFVRHYSAMVEFYRLVSGTEMESSKPGFCLFPLRNDTFIGKRKALECELALKHCPYVVPYPLSDAYLTFPVTNVASLRTILRSYIQKISTHRYLVHDPDGNAVILHDVSVLNILPEFNLAPFYCHLRPKDYLDKASVHSDSIDSGRFSDFDACSSELDQCMSKLIVACSLTTENRPLQAQAFLPYDSDCTGIKRLAGSSKYKNARKECCAVHGTADGCECWTCGHVKALGQPQEKSNPDFFENKPKVKIGTLKCLQEKALGKKKN